MASLASDRKAAKKAENIRQAQLRLERLQAAQRQEKEEKAMRPRLERMYDDMDNYVRSALSGHFSVILKKWLAGRTATFERVQRFFDERPHLWLVPPTDPVLRIAAETAILSQKKAA